MSRPFRQFGPTPWVEPIPRVGRMPVTLMRGSLVTRDPAQMEAALEDYENEAPAIDFILPQRAQWQQWKSNTIDLLWGGANRPRHAPPLQRVAGLYEAMLTGRGPEYLTGLPDFAHSIAQEALAHSGAFYSAPFDQSPMLFRDAPAQGRPIPTPGGEEWTPFEEAAELRAEGQGVDRALREIEYTGRRVTGYLLSEVRAR